jgi:3',5'-cyclic AMP phosphodiesterase CpdA
MGLTRRRLIWLGSLGGLTLAFFNKQLMGRTLGYKVAREANFQVPKPLTTPPGELLIRFVATADSGAGDRNQRTVGEAMHQYRAQNPYDLVIMAGDNIYTNGEIEKIKEAFEDPYKKLLAANVRFQAALGNHDIRTNNGNDELNYKAFNMKSRYYTYSAGKNNDAQFFVLDTNGNADWKAQMAWLETELKASKALWKIVYGHHPIYSSGLYGTDPKMVKRFAPLFKQYGVQLYINGHEHNYERTQPIDGTVYLITGHGGAHLRTVGRSDWTAHAESEYGFSAIALYGDRLEIQGIDGAGKVFDRGVISYLKSTAT